MRLNEMYLSKSYHNAMILQYKDILQSEGFKVELDKKIPNAKNMFYADLFATKGEDARLYEFKVIQNDNSKNKKHEKTIRQIKEIAATLNAKPIVVYVNPPEKKEIKIEGLEDGLYTYIISEPQLPSEIERISSNAEIVSIKVLNINNINISPHIILVDGEAIINIKLHPINDLDEVESFPMIFKAELVPNNGELSLLKIQEYFIDTSSW